MKFKLKHIIPTPLKDQEFSNTSVWASEIELDCTKNYVLTAESGKGKSTFISFLYALRNDYSGTILLDEKDINHYNSNQLSEIRQQKLSIVFQDLKLFGDISLIDNLIIKNELTQHKTLDEIHTYIYLLGLKGKENQLASTLSYGQQQRVAIIRSILQPFDFLLLDEPFSHLDEKNSIIAFDLIKKECSNNNAGYLISSLDALYANENKLSI